MISILNDTISVIQAGKTCVLYFINFGDILACRKECTEILLTSLLKTSLLVCFHGVALRLKIRLIYKTFNTKPIL